MKEWEDEKKSDILKMKKRQEQKQIENEDSREMDNVS